MFSIKFLMAVKKRTTLHPREEFKKLLVTKRKKEKENCVQIIISEKYKSSNHNFVEN